MSKIAGHPAVGYVRLGGRKDSKGYLSSVAD